MLTAINQRTEQVIFAGRYSDIRNEYPEFADLVDPITRKPVFPRRAILQGQRAKSKIVDQAGYYQGDSLTQTLESNLAGANHAHFSTHIGVIPRANRTVNIDGSSAPH